MRAVVVIPTLRGGPGLVDLVAGLRADGAEVRIADNGLPGGDRAALVRAGAAVDAMGGNLGFGRAVNTSAARTTAEAIVVVNDDVVPEPGFLGSLVGALDVAEMAAGVLLQDEAPGVVESAGIVVDRHLGCYDHLQHHDARTVGATTPAPLGPCGGAAAYRRAAFDRVGGFDPGFFAYYEDVDLALRLRGSGADCALAWDARARHVGSATLGYHSLAKARVVARSRGRLLRKHGALRSFDGAPWVLGTEALVVAALLRRHRSLAPGRERLAGFAGCETRLPRPRGVATVGVREGLRRRHGRSRRRLTR